MSDQADHLAKLTGLGAKERQDALRWYARQGEAVRVSLMRDRHKLFHALRAHQDKRKPALVDYAALLIACKQNGYLAEKKYRSKRSPEDRELEQISRHRKARALGLKAATSKREQLAKKWAVVVELRSEGHSFATIAKYLSREHKIKVSRQYLCDIYQEWENKKC